MNDNYYLTRMDKTFGVLELLDAEALISKACSQIAKTDYGITNGLVDEIGSVGDIQKELLESKRKLSECIDKLFKLEVNE